MHSTNRAVAVTHHATSLDKSRKENFPFFIAAALKRPTENAYQRTCLPLTKYMSEKYNMFKFKHREEKKNKNKNA